MLLTVLRPSCRKDSSFSSILRARVPKTVQAREKKRKAEYKLRNVVADSGHAYRHTPL